MPECLVTCHLADVDAMKEPATSIIFEAKWDNVQATKQQVIKAAESYCKQHRCVEACLFSTIFILLLFSMLVLRGCVTNGEQWIFFIYCMQDDGSGLVSFSYEYNIGKQYEGLPLILGLLHDWVCKFQSNFCDDIYLSYRSTTPLVAV